MLALVCTTPKKTQAESEPPGPWRLHIGIHNGTLMSRDDGWYENIPDLATCKERVSSDEAWYKGIGYVIWFAQAIAADGTEVKLHEGNVYV